MISLNPNPEHCVRFRFEHCSQCSEPDRGQSRQLRVSLSENVNNQISLELKNTSKGVISWSTRGQLGLVKGIKATTGFQSMGYSTDEMASNFKNILATPEKSFEYTQFRIRSAKDVFKKGGHVTAVYRDQKVRMLYDNRRVILEKEDTGDSFDMSKLLLDSKPFQTKEECTHARFLSKFSATNPYLKRSVVKISSKSLYRNFLEIGVRNFVKGYLAKEPLFGLRGTEFRRYKDLIGFIYGFDQAKTINLSKQTVSNLKRRRLFLRPVPNTKVNVEFIAYIKSKIPYFEESLFLKS